MGQRTGLQRLFRLRRLEEETERMAVELAAVARNRIEGEAIAEQVCERDSRRELHRQIANIDTLMRAAAASAMEDAVARRRLIHERLQVAEATVEHLRNAMLRRRMERQQVESLLEKETTRVREQDLRRAQQLLDDWFNQKDSRGKSVDGRKGQQERD
jgi:flagellar biosynthesis chaperone FliJ